MSEDNFDILFGLIMFYTWIHFYVIQFTKSWNQRNGYEKALTIASAVFLALVIAGLEE